MKYALFYFILSFFYTAVAAQKTFLFEENKGQWNEEVLYKSHIPGGFLFITKSGLKYLYLHPDDAEQLYGHNHQQPAQDLLRKAEDAHGIRMQAIEVVFQDGNGNHNSSPLKPLESRVNYFLGDDPKSWSTDVKSYEEVTIQNVYDNIDFRIYSKDDRLKYDFIIHPKGEPSVIQLEFNGATGVSKMGEVLEITTDFSSTLEGVPFSYQGVTGHQKSITCQYSLSGQTVRFDLPEGYDPSEDLIIDPELIFSTYSGSQADNWGFTATYDDDGNLYSGGIVRDIGFPVTNGAFQQNYAGNVDIGILKFNEDGTQLLYATYIGGSEAETPQSMIVNKQGELVIFGTTSSINFPTTIDAYQTDFQGGEPMNNSPGGLGEPIGAIPFNNGSDFYVLKLSPDGKTLVSSTLLGGTGNDGVMLQHMPLTKNYGDQFRGEVNIDKEDNVYFASFTSSIDFPLNNAIQNTYAGGLYDGVVVKLSPDLSALLFSSYLGGSGMDGLYSIKVDSKNNIILAGGTDSEDYPIKGDVKKPLKQNTSDIDGIISKISLDGDSLVASTFVGTNGYDQIYFVELDSADRIYVLGQTNGDMLVTPDVYVNQNSGQFIQSYGENLDTIYFSTVFGSGSGSPDIRPTAFLVNECQNILISGWGGASNTSIIDGVPTGYVGGNTFNLPVTDNAFRSTSDGSDFYIMVLLKDARQLLYSTFFGGNQSVDHVDGGTSRFDNRGIVYQSVCASCRGFNDFPTTPGAWSSTNNSQSPYRNCNNAVFKFDVTLLKADFITNSFEWDKPGLRTGCWPLEIAFKNTSIGGIDFEWDFGNGITSFQEDSLYITYEDPGFYNVSLKATDIATCLREDIAFGSIEVFDQTFSLVEPEKICFGDAIQLEAGGGISYRWTPADQLNNPNIHNPIATPDTTTYFTAEVTNNLGCIAIDSVLITVVPEFNVGFSFTKKNQCFSSPEIIFKNLSINVADFTWDLGNGETSNLDSLMYNFNSTDTFMVSLTGRLDICENVSTMEVPSVETKVPNVITPNDDGRNDVFQIITDEPVDLKILNRWGDAVYEKKGYQNDFDGSGLAPAVYYYELEFQQDGATCHGWLHILK